MRMRIISAALAVVCLATVARGQATRPDLEKEKVLYVVGYAHLDTQWRWTYPIVIRDYIRNTMEQNFPLIEKYPDYIFNFTGARRYQFMKEYFPEDFAKVQQYVKEGRWYPAGSSVDECDTDSPSAESLVRQILYGNQFFRREFGVAPSDLMLPDTFGFTAALPEICAHCGVKGFSTQKLSWGSAVGIPFTVGTWEGPDGRSILAALDPGSYTGVVDGDLSNGQTFLDRINKLGQMSGVFVDYRYYGTGDRGGAPKETSAAALETSVHGTGPVHVVAARADQMFKDITDAEAAKLPHYKGELLLTWHSAGSITSESAMKRWNRKNELLADAAERASVAAAWLGAAPYPAARLYNAWMIVLGSQMHDMMAGTAMPTAYDFIWNDELLALNQFGAVTTNAVGGVAGSLNTQGPGVSVVVYNPLAFARTDVAEATIEYPAGQVVPETVRVAGPDGKEVASQVLDRDRQRLHILFVATVQPVGMAVYEVLAGAVTGGASELSVSKDTIENAHFRVRLNSDGDISAIFDKTSNQQVMGAPARLVFLTERPTQYPAWNMYWEDQQRPPRAYVGGAANVRVVENGPVRVTLEVTREAEGSKFVQQIRLAAGEAGDRVEVANTIDWQTPESALKAVFPFSFGNPMATYDCQIGALQRGNDDPKKFEVPQHQWFNLDDPSGNFGVAVLNDCKYGSDKPDDRTMRLTLLYTPRAPRGTYHDQATQDMGRQIMTYAIAPHAGDWRQANVPRMGQRLNQPLMTFQATAHAGGLGRNFSLLRVSSDHVAVEAIKKAEDSDEIIIRLRETQGQAAHVVVSGAAPFASAREVDGQENPVGPATLDDRGDMAVDLGAYGLRAFAVKFGAAPSPVAAQATSGTPVDLDYNLDGVSSATNPTDGGLGIDSATYPAEEWPDSLSVDGVSFRLGSKADGVKNVLSCQGQEISLPAGTRTVHLLAAAIDGDRQATFELGGSAMARNIQDWASPIGEWDQRIWKTPPPDVDYHWDNECVGLVPGFLKPAEVAWYSNHRHDKTGNEYYHYCYLFKYDLEAPSGGASSLKLPNDAKVLIFALTADATAAGVRAAAPLSDTLADRESGNAPEIFPAAGTFNDSVIVTIQHPLYWQENELRFTLDGSDPTSASPVYSGPIELDGPVTVKAAMIRADDRTGPVVSAAFDVRDVTPPSVVSATLFDGTPVIHVIFSKRMEAESAQVAANYQLRAAGSVAKVQVDPDGRGAVLTVDRDLKGSDGASLTVQGVRDVSPSHKEIESNAVALTVEHPAYALADDVKTSKQADADGLPTKAEDSWTLNFFCRPNKMPANRTLLAGFGSIDAQVDGQGRYLSKFSDGLHFWSHNEDVAGSVKLDVGKWQMLTATFDGQELRMFKNGQPAGTGLVVLRNDDATVRIEPLDPWDFKRTMDGEIRGMTVWKVALPPAAVAALEKADAAGN